MDETQHRIRTRGHAQMPGEASAGLATQRKAYMGLSSSKPAGASSAWREKPRQRFDERAPPTGGMVAVEAADREPQRYGFAEAWKIGRMPDVSAMNGRAWRAAVGTASTIPSNVGGNDERTGVPDNAVNDAAWQG